MKYYVYISDSKLDMLAEQVPVPIRKRIAAELSIDVKVFSVALQTKSQTETRHAKLSLVEKFIDENDLAGTVDSPKEYFRGSLPMTFSSEFDTGDGPMKMLFASGRTSTTRLGLAGSWYHMIDERSDRVEIGKDDARSRPGSVLRAIDPELRDLVAGPRDESGEPLPSFESRALKAVRHAVEHSQGLTRNFEFLAVTMLRGKEDEGASSGPTILLGSPIYMARASGGS